VLLKVAQLGLAGGFIVRVVVCFRHRASLARRRQILIRNRDCLSHVPALKKRLKVESAEIKEPRREAGSINCCRLKQINQPIASSNVPVFEQSSCCDLVIPASQRRRIPSHRISQPIINIEQERDFHGVLNCLLRNARPHHRSHVLGPEAGMVECHLLEQPQGCAKLFTDWSFRVLVEDLLD
jgi:hypothetical protein